jgi:CHAT domain-containing protein
MYRFLLVILLLWPVSAVAYTPEEFLADDRRSQDIYRIGDVEGAVASAREVYQKALEAFGPVHPYTFEAGITLGNMLSYNREYEAALAHLTALYDVAAKNLLQYDASRIKVSVAYANVLSDMGEPSKALPLFIDAAAAAEFLLGPDNDTTLIFYFNVAGAYSRLGQGEEALLIYERLAASYERNASPENLSQRSNLYAQMAYTQYDIGRPLDAVATYEKALPLLVAYWGPNHPRVLSIQSSYAYALWAARQRDGLPVLLDAMSRSADITFGSGSLFHSDILDLRALTLTEGGPGTPGFDDGLALMRQSIELKAGQLPETHPALGRSMLNYAAMVEDAGDLAQAVTYGLRAETANSPSRDFLINTLVAAAEAGAVEEDFIAAELFRILQQASVTDAGFATRQLATRMVMGEGDGSAQFRAMTDAAQAQSQLEAQLLAAISLPLVDRDAQMEADLRRAITETAAQGAAAEAALDESFPRVADLTGNGALTIPEAQALLGPEGALVILDISTREGAPHLAFAVTEEGVSFRRLNWTAESFDQAVGDVRRGISLKLGTRAAAALDDSAAENQEAFDFDAASWLYQETIGQVLGITGKRKHLYVDARGPLASLPPHLMISDFNPEANEQTARWLIRDFAITVLPSVFSLKVQSLANTGARAKLPLLGFANPVYTETGGGFTGEAGQTLRNVLLPLPETEGELLQVAAAVKADETVQKLGVGASEAVLKSTSLEDYGILYFATHGLVAGDAVGQSVLSEPALALTAGDGQDGLLTASEIMELRLNADWVILSACNTAVGDEPGAQALSGLAKAFTYAGARSLLVSHWPVESRSAVRLMTDLFARKAAEPGVPTAIVQQEAILAMIDAPSDPRWSHPAYWAPFVLVGSPD